MIEVHFKYPELNIYQIQHAYTLKTYDVNTVGRSFTEFFILSRDIDSSNIVLQPSCLERFPSFYNSIYSSSFKKFIRGKKFEYLVLGMLLLNLVAVVIETTVSI